MRLGIVGDTHGSLKALGIIERLFQDVTLLFHTGDHWQDGLYLEKKMGIPVLTVRGNCDSGSFPFELVHTVQEKNFFLTHGHRYWVKFRLNSLMDKVKAEGVDYCLFGHTHRPLIMEKEGTHFLNPGSIAYPRGKERYAGIILAYQKNAFIPHFVNIDRG